MPFIDQMTQPRHNHVCCYTYTVCFSFFLSSFFFFSCTKNADPLDQKKYIVYQDQLMSLFEECGVCKGRCSIKILQPRSFGSLIQVKATCAHCRTEKTWASQPKISDVPAGNLLLSCGALYAGESPAAKKQSHGSAPYPRGLRALVVSRKLIDNKLHVALADQSGCIKVKVFQNTQKHEHSCHHRQDVPQPPAQVSGTGRSNHMEGVPGQSNSRASGEGWTSESWRWWTGW